ncbi:hypothetical protein [Parasitella parasitica]|uniref:Uncharacterized protein n=1 Tax=Parasitella parasitica TaxID=35722 RepID=A0A0B7NHU4_9FUNG|nr:hypothetical protein [Parasitella parasitica]
MNTVQLERALKEMPLDALITEIPEIQNFIEHLLKSNQEMREFDPFSTDLEFIQAIKENAELIIRKERQVDITLQVIRERIGEAAWREMGSNVREFRERHAQDLKAEEKLQLIERKEQEAEEGLFL